MKRLVARDHREAYDLWARCFDDPALMANRDPEITRFVVRNVAEKLPLRPDCRLLDVGPGDGALFRLVSSRVARCCGVDPTPDAVAKLRRLFRDVDRVEFAVGSSEAIPYGDGEFDVVVMNSVIMILPSRQAAERTLGELVRVCAPGGTVFVGEVPFVSELASGVLPVLARRWRDFGTRRFARNLYRTYVRPALRGYPLLVGPVEETLHFEPEEFSTICRRLGARVECSRHREPRRLSTTRNDYLLTLPPG